MAHRDAKSRQTSKLVEPEHRKRKDHHNIAEVVNHGGGEHFACRDQASEFNNHVKAHDYLIQDDCTRQRVKRYDAHRAVGLLVKEVHFDVVAGPAKKTTIDHESYSAAHYDRRILICLRSAALSDRH